MSKSFYKNLRHTMFQPLVVERLYLYFVAIALFSISQIPLTGSATLTAGPHDTTRYDSTGPHHRLSTIKPVPATSCSPIPNVDCTGKDICPLVRYRRNLSHTYTMGVPLPIS